MQVLGDFRTVTARARRERVPYWQTMERAIGKRRTSRGHLPHAHIVAAVLDQAPPVPLWYSVRHCSMSVFLANNNTVAQHDPVSRRRKLVDGADRYQDSCAVFRTSFIN